MIRYEVILLNPLVLVVLFQNLVRPIGLFLILKPGLGDSFKFQVPLRVVVVNFEINVFFHDLLMILILSDFLFGTLFLPLDVVTQLSGFKNQSF